MGGLKMLGWCRVGLLEREVGRWGWGLRGSCRESASPLSLIWDQEESKICVVAESGR